MSRRVRSRVAPLFAHLAVIAGCAVAVGAGGCGKSGSIVGGQCAAGYAQCESSCVDLSTDPLNCGACGHACAAGVACAGGVCAGVPVTGAGDASVGGGGDGGGSDAGADGTGSAGADSAGDVSSTADATAADSPAADAPGGGRALR